MAKHLFERVSRIQGLSPKEFVAYVLLADALSDLAEAEFPDLAGLLADEEKDVVSSLKKLIKKKDLDLEDYLDPATAEELISALEAHWDNKISFEDFLTFDRDAAINLVLQMAGNKIEVQDDPRVAKFLKSNLIDIPKDSLGVSEKVFRKAYRAAEDLMAEDVRVAMPQSLVMETVNYAKANLKRDLVRGLGELQVKFYPKDREIDYMIKYLESLR